MRPLPLEELARLLGAELHGAVDPSIAISGVSEPATASAEQLALLTDPTRVEEAPSSSAAAFLVKRVHERLPAPQLVCVDPPRALAKLLELFKPQTAPSDSGVDGRAAVDDRASVAADAWVGPFAYVGPEATVGSGSRVEPFSYVGEAVTVGRRCVIGPGATLLPGSRIADGVTLGPGAVVGYRGFGFWRDAEGWHPISSPGGVAIGRDVELGANTCVDAGTLAPTLIDPGAKIDNLVQVGHNGAVGARALLCAQVGLAGSVRVGEDAVLGGQAGVADHRRLGKSCRVGAQSGIAQDVAEGSTVSGYPAIPHRAWLRSSAIFARLGEMRKQVRELRERLGQILEQG